MKWINCNTRLPHKDDIVAVKAIYKRPICEKYIGPFRYLGDGVFYSDLSLLCLNLGPDDMCGFADGMAYQWKPYINKKSNSINKK